MRRLLLLVALAMVAALVLAPAAVAATSGAQENVECGDVSHGKAQAILAKDPSDPNGLDADNDGEACEENAGDGSAATPEADDSTATSEADDETATSNATAEADDDETATATATADSIASATALPDTGGSPLALGLAPLALLVGGGIVALGFVRRR